LAAVKNFDMKQAGANIKANGQAIANSQETVKNKIANNDPNTQAGVASPSTYAAMGMEPPKTASSSAAPAPAPAPATTATAPKPAAPAPAAPAPATTATSPTAPTAPSASSATTAPATPATGEGNKVQEGDDDLAAMRRIMNHRR
jgi:hypothetical protein